MLSEIFHDFNVEYEYRSKLQYKAQFKFHSSFIALKAKKELIPLILFSPFPSNKRLMLMILFGVIKELINGLLNSFFAYREGLLSNQLFI